MAGREESSAPRRWITGKRVVAVVLLAAALVFVFSNLQQGTISFFGVHTTMPVWIWFLVVLALGVVAGSLFPWLRPRRRR